MNLDKKIQHSIKLIKNAKCFVAISGYDSPLYNELFSGLKKNINKISKANVGKIETRECLWTNYDIDKLQGQLKLNM